MTHINQNIDFSQPPTEGIKLTQFLNGPFAYGVCARFQVPNKRLAVEPFPQNSVKKEVKGGVLTIANRNTLQPLKVVFGNDNFQEGQTVYLLADRFSATWAKPTAIFEVDGKRFILIPEDEVMLVERYGDLALQTTLVDPTKLDTP